jgi:hypothetical protein
MPAGFAAEIWHKMPRFRVLEERRMAAREMLELSVVE